MFGHVVRETFDKIVIFGEGNDRYDIPKSEIQTTGRNVLIGLYLNEIANRYKVDRQEQLPTTVPLEQWTQGENIDLATYERKYPKGLFNKGVRVLNEDHVGHVMKETNDKIVIFGDHNYRFDVPKSKIKEVGRNVILNIEFPELASKYKIDRNAPLPTGEPIEKINDEAYRETYHREVKGGGEGEKRKYRHKKITEKSAVIDRKLKEEIMEDDNIKNNNNNTAKSIVNMIMGDNNQFSENAASSSSPTPVVAPLEIVDAQTLVDN